MSGTPTVARRKILTVIVASLVLHVVPAPAIAASSLPSPPTLENAHAMAMTGRFIEARREYAEVAREQRRLGILPSEALWSLAQMLHGEGKVRSAARVLNSLAFEASIAGDPAVQARAQLEATLLFASLGADAEVERGRRQLEQLRLSPYVGPELRTEIERRLRLS